MQNLIYYGSNRIIKPKEVHMLTRCKLLFIALSIAYLISYADSVNDDYESSPADSTLHSVESHACYTYKSYDDLT